MIAFVRRKYYYSKTSRYECIQNFTSVVNKKFLLLIRITNRIITLFLNASYFNSLHNIIYILLGSLFTLVNFFFNC